MKFQETDQLKQRHWGGCGSRDPGSSPEACRAGVKREAEEWAAVGPGHVEFPVSGGPSASALSKAGATEWLWRTLSRNRGLLTPTRLGIKEHPA